MLRNANQWRNCCEWGAGSDVKEGEGAMKCREGSVKGIREGSVPMSRV